MTEQERQRAILAICGAFAGAPLIGADFWDVEAEELTAPPSDVAAERRDGTAGYRLSFSVSAHAVGKLPPEAARLLAALQRASRLSEVHPAHEIPEGYNLRTLDDPDSVLRLDPTSREASVRRRAQSERMMLGKPPCPDCGTIDTTKLPRDQGCPLDSPDWRLCPLAR